MSQKYERVVSIRSNRRPDQQRSPWQRSSILECRNADERSNRMKVGVQHSENCTLSDPGICPQQSFSSRRLFALTAKNFSRSSTIRYGTHVGRQSLSGPEGVCPRPSRIAPGGIRISLLQETPALASRSTETTQWLLFSSFGSRSGLVSS
jgi:hypothetical protein